MLLLVCIGPDGKTALTWGAVAAQTKVPAFTEWFTCAPKLALSSALQEKMGYTAVPKARVNAFSKEASRAGPTYTQKPVQLTPDA